MKNVYEIAFTEEELTELAAAYAFAYTVINEEPYLAEFALHNFKDGNRTVQSSIATKIQTILKLKLNNAQKTI